MTEDNQHINPDETPEDNSPIPAPDSDTPQHSSLPDSLAVDPAASPDVVRHQLKGMYQSWFLEYASYVILERAVPGVDDGLKPVQRRILHSMHTLDDGRFNKVANIVGNTMQYHPHGDASIYEALVQLGQKDLLVETQGNWGNVLTGASAAAGRYIEARLSQFALDVLYSPKVTEWTLSYDGRKREPVSLPSKFPLLLAQGVEGIAVGLSSKILPHNFNEIIDAAVAYLRGEEFTLYPDFVTGGFIDVSRYNDGQRGGAVRIRAKIEKVDNKTLAITEIPYGKTTGTIIDSILKAFESGKIKIRKVDDNTSHTARILVHLLAGTSSDKTIDALYAFTDCEVSVSPNCCVISNKKPHFVGVSDVLRHNVDSTRAILCRELEIQRDELREQLFFASLEQIFIEERIYKDKEYEQSKSKEEATRHIHKRLQPFTAQFIREVTDEDIDRLYEIKMGRILRFNVDKNEELMASLRGRIEEIEGHLAHITDYTINWFLRLKEKYGAEYPRRTVIRAFDNIQAASVAEANEKLMFNREEGFIGTALKKDDKTEIVGPCSSIDDVILFYRDGRYKVVRIQEKLFVGKNVIFVGVFKQRDERTVYNTIYQNGRGGAFYMKRFKVTGVTRDREYNLTPGEPGTRVAWFTCNPNGEAETVNVTLKPRPRLNKLQIEVDFSALAIKGRGAMGNLVTKNEVARISLKRKGVSTLGGREVWFDPDVLRLNYEGRGEYLGEFGGTDLVLVVLKNGEYYTSTFDAANHYEDNILRIEKFRPGTVWTAILNDADQGYPYIKRFTFEPSAKRQRWLGDNEKSSLIALSDAPGARFEVTFGGNDAFRPAMEIVASEFIAVKSFKAKGKRLTTFELGEVKELEPLDIDPQEEDIAPDADAQTDDQPDNIEEIEERSDDEVRDELTGQQRIF
ncbi:MAG: DNA gyrase/topoisomerase IV subunit A [Bacteroides sp.]|nr:DNA gyrase/topoisomerase IV subunit A [Bacteroides sp.]